MDFEYSDYWIAPDFISRGLDNNYKATKQCTLRYFKEDAETLGLQVFPSTIREKIGADKYRIAIYVKNGDDFHFARQDSNGKWSEKIGWRKGIKMRKTVIKIKIDTSLLEFLEYQERRK